MATEVLYAITIDDDTITAQSVGGARLKQQLSHVIGHLFCGPFNDEHFTTLGIPLDRGTRIKALAYVAKHGSLNGFSATAKQQPQNIPPIQTVKGRILHRSEFIAKKKIEKIQCLLHPNVAYGVSGSKSSAMPLIQCRFPVVALGPSLKTCPKCPPQVAQCSSVRVTPIL